MPTMVIWGDHDPFFSVAQGQRTASAIPGARFVLFEGAGHFLPEERPHAFADQIVAQAAKGAKR
jgi:pimeloyl-ACP methyl ester carboxylesterase